MCGHFCFRRNTVFRVGHEEGIWSRGVLALKKVYDLGGVWLCNGDVNVLWGMRFRFVQVCDEYVER